MTCRALTPTVESRSTAANPAPIPTTQPTFSDTSPLGKYNVFNNYTTKSPLFHVTADDISVPVEPLELTRFAATGPFEAGVEIAVLYGTHWKGLLRPAWERESDLLLFRQHILNTGPARPCNFDRRTGYTAVCTWVSLNASSPATRALFSCLPDTAIIRQNRQTWARRFSGTIMLVGAYKRQDHIWWLRNFPRTLQLLGSM